MPCHVLRLASEAGLSHLRPYASLRSVNPPGPILPVCLDPTRPPKTWSLDPFACELVFQHTESLGTTLTPSIAIFGTLVATL